MFRQNVMTIHTWLQKISWPILGHAIRNTCTVAGGCFLTALFLSHHGIWLSPLYASGVAGAYFSEKFWRELRLKKGLY